MFELCRHSNYSAIADAGSVYINKFIGTRDEIDQSRYPLQKRNMKGMLCLGWTFTNCEEITKCQFARLLPVCPKMCKESKQKG